MMHAKGLVSGLALAIVAGGLVRGSEVAAPAVSFATGSRIDLGSEVALTGDLTVEYWFATERAANWRVFNNSGHFDYSIGHTGDNGIRIWDPTTDIVLTESFATDAWEHFALTREGSTVRIYRGGVQIGSTTWSGSLALDRIGGQSGSTGWSGYAGRAAEVRAWDYARSAAEIQANMSWQLAGTEAGLVGYWPMDEETGLEVQDRTANANHGTIGGSGATWTEDGPPVLDYGIASFDLVHPVTGSTGFVNQLTVDIAVLLVPTVADPTFILSPDDDTAPAPGDARWGALPGDFTFAAADESDTLTLYLWVKDAEDEIIGESASIVYTTATLPVITAADGITVQTYPNVPIRIDVADMGITADGGSHGGTELDLFSIGISRTDAPADQTPGEPYVTLELDTVGTHELAITITAINEAGNVSAPFSEDVTVEVAAFDGATGNLTWEGEAAGVLNRNWILGDNWSGGLPPANPTSGTLTFDDTDISATEAKLLAPIPDFEGTTPTNTWRIGAMRASNNSGWHVIDLGGLTLETVNDLRVERGGSGTARLELSGAGNVGVGRDVLVTRGHLVFGDTTIERHPTLDRTIRTLTAGTSGGGASVDLRGTTIKGGVLDLTNLSIGIGRGQGTMHIDETTDMHTLRVTGAMRMHSGQNATARIGAENPADGLFYLPDGLNLIFGDRDAGAGGRGELSLTHYTDGHMGTTHTVGRFVAGDGGSFDAWLSILRVGHTTSQYQGPVTGILDLRGVDTFQMDATEARIGTRGNHARVANGWVYFPAGTGRVDRLYMGDNVSSIASRLDLTGTVLEIDELLDLRDTGTNTRLTARVLGQPSGLDLAAGATITTTGIGTPKIYLRFEEAPEGGQTPHWGLRQAGDHAVTITGWVDSGLIVPTMHFAGAEDDYQMVVYYDSDADYTYAGLLGADEELPPVIEAQDLEAEVRDQTSVRIGPDDILAGVSNPSDIEEQSRAISHASLHDGEEQPYLDFPTDGTLPVTYTDVMVTLHFEGDITVSDTADVTFLPATAGVTDSLTWEGRARLQYDARREWQWSQNWSGDAPPVNPTPGTLTFGDDDTDDVVAKRLAPVADWEGATPTNVWQIASLRAGSNAGWHVLDLDGQTLRTTGQVLASRLDSGAANMKIQNGTLDVGTDLRVLNSSTLDLSDMGGSLLSISNRLQAHSGGTLTLDGGVVLSGRTVTYEIGYGSGAELDLRGTQVEGGVLDLDVLRLGGGGDNTGTLRFDTNTLHTLLVRNIAHFNGDGARGGAFIGDQVNGQWVLPSDTDLRFGTVESPAEMIIGARLDWVAGGNDSLLVASEGGTFEAWLDTLTVGRATGNQSQNRESILDIRNMDSMTLSAATFNIGIGDSGQAPRGDVFLCPGEVVVGDLTLGHTGFNANSRARLVLDDTRFSVTNSFTGYSSTQIEINVRANRASGLELPALPAMTEGASMSITFEADPAHGQLHYGLKIAGNVAEALQDALVDPEDPQPDQWLSVDDEALTGTQATIFTVAGDTYLGVPPPPGSLFLIR